MTRDSSYFKEWQQAQASKGGSIAQRDLIEWTLLEAAIRSGEEKIAQSLVNERLSSRPDSHVNARFLGGIEV